MLVVEEITSILLRKKRLKMKKYFELKENEQKNTHLEVEIYYSLGGMNYFTGREEKRGYYLSVSPIAKSNGCISYIGFSGIKSLIKEVGRKSVKAEKEAENIVKNTENGISALNNLVNQVLAKNNLQLKEDVIL